MKTMNVLRPPALCLAAILLMAALLLPAASCAHYSRMSEVRRESAAPLPRTWLIEAVDLDSRAPDPSVEKKIPEIIGLLAGKYRTTVVADRPAAGEPYALCRVWIREQPITRSLDRYNSIAGLLTLADPASGRVLARAVYAEESEESIRSFQRLYLVIEELVRSLSASAGG